MSAADKDACAGDAASPAAAALQALRQQGAPQLDPVGWRHVEALARRAAGHQGLTRRLLDDRLAQLVAASGARVGQAGRAASTAPAMRRVPAAGPLAQLLADIGHPAAVAAAAASGGTTEPGSQASGSHGAPAMPELKAVRNYRSTWARLKMDQRLAQARAQVPANAGPLHTQRLLHELLATLRDASPVYLQRVMAQMEVWLWLEQAAAGGDEAPRAGASKLRKPGARQGARPERAPQA